MYINPFWCGVICTLLIEIVCIGIFIITNVRRVTIAEVRHERSEDDNDQSNE